VVAAFRDDAFEPDFAGVRKDSSPVAFEVLVVLDPDRRFGEQPRERGLPFLERPWPPVLAVDLQQVEGVKERRSVVGSAMSISKTATPASSQQTASPSTTAETAGRAATALRMSG
jgi:hypothetical protein